MASMSPEDLQKLLDAAEPEDRLGLVHSYIMEKSWSMKFPSPHKDVILPRHILGLGTSSATIASSANKARDDQTIRLVISPLSGGPYSVVGDTVKGNNTLAQPVMASLSGLAPATTYWFVVQIVNDEDGSIALQSEESFFTTLSHNPLTKWATDVRMTTATITATANVGANERANFLYSKADKDDFKTVPRGLSAKLTGLIPGTEYLYYLQVTDLNGNVLDESVERSFTTLDFVIDCTVSNILASSVMVAASAHYVEPNNAIQLLYKAQGEKQYKTLGVEAGTDTKAQATSFRLDNLKSKTKYSAKAQVVDPSGRVLYESKDTPFQTLSFEPLLSAVDLKAATVTLVAVARNLSPEDKLSIFFEGNPCGSTHASLLDLTPNTEYAATLQVGDDSAEISFKTGSHTPEVVDVLNVKDRTATLFGTAVWVPRRGFARFAWGKSPGQCRSQSQLMFGDDSELQSFAQLIFGLEPLSEYYFILEVLASDGTTVTMRSDELSFTTTEATRMRKNR